jgi:ABC-2 type transport system permease protein
MMAAVALWWREVVRFFRQRGRVVGAIGTPVVFWLFLGFGLDDTFVVPGAPEVGYLRYFFAGMLLLVLLFTAIFATISVIEDRKAGFLQAVMASPSPRWAIAAGKVAGGATLAATQGVVLLALWPIVGEGLGGVEGVLRLLGAAGVLVVGAVLLTGIGLCFAWRSGSVAGYHAVMNLVLMPMWLLSGAVFPVKSAPVGLQAVMYANPLTYVHALLSWALVGEASGGASGGGGVAATGPGVALAVVGVATVGVMGLAVWVVRRPGSAG